MALPSIRYYIDLIEGIQAPWGISKTAFFDESFAAMARKVPDLRERLQKFIEIKSPNPPVIRYGKNDYPFINHQQLRGVIHCHLAPDVILIYRLANHSIQLMLLCQHADIEGKRLKQTIRRLAA